MLGLRTGLSAPAIEHSASEPQQKFAATRLDVPSVKVGRGSCRANAIEERLRRSVAPPSLTVQTVGLTTDRPENRSADFQCAVSPISNRQGAGKSQRARTGRRLAEYNSAIRQSATLHYEVCRPSRGPSSNVSDRRPQRGTGLQPKVAGHELPWAGGLHLLGIDSNARSLRFHSHEREPSTMGINPNFKPRECAADSPNLSANIQA